MTHKQWPLDVLQNTHTHTHTHACTTHTQTHIKTDTHTRVYHIHADTHKNRHTHAHLHNVTSILLSDAFLQLFLAHPITSQLTQNIGRFGLLELQVDSPIVSGNDAIWRAGNQTQLIHSNTRTPGGVGARRQRSGI